MAKYTKETTLYRKSKLQDALDKAQTTAAEAQSTADDAKTTAEAAQKKAKATAAHFWSDSEGAHVTYTEEGETIAGGNVLISTDGLSVRDGETTLASFGKNMAQIGKSSSQKIMITDSDFKVLKGNGDVAAEITSSYGDTGRTTSEEITDYTYILAHEPISDSAISVRPFMSDAANFTQGVPGSATIKATYGSNIYNITYDGIRTFTINNIKGWTYVTYETSEIDDKVMRLAKNNVQIGWDGSVTAKKVSVHGDITTDSGGLVNKMQAGYINITPGSTTKTYNGIKYYEGTATVTFAQAFDSEPSISLVPSTSVPYKMALGVSNVSKTGFTIEFFRDSQTGAGIHWTAMPRTQ